MQIQHSLFESMLQRRSLHARMTSYRPSLSEVPGFTVPLNYEVEVHLAPFSDTAPATNEIRKLSMMELAS